MNKVYLVGLPGAGKTHCGRWLAKQLDWDFLDLDAAIETETQLKISEIFDREGEDAFRQTEAEALRRTKSLKNTVISCGGGTAAWHDNMEWMQRHGLTVYINTPIDKIVARISQNSSPRPLFAGLKDSQIRKKLSEIHENRGEYYSRAKLIWNKDLPEDGFYNAVYQLLALYSARF